MYPRQNSPREEPSSVSSSACNSLRRTFYAEDRLSLEGTSRKNILPDIRLSSAAATASSHRRNSSFGQTHRSSRSGSSDHVDTPNDDIIFGFGASLSSEQMRAMFPFHIVINNDFHILQMGSKISRWLRTKSLIRSFDQVNKYFQFIDANHNACVSWDWNQIIKFNGQYIELEFAWRDPSSPTTTNNNTSNTPATSSPNPAPILRLGGEMHSMNILHVDGITWQSVFLLSPVIRSQEDYALWQAEIPNLLLSPTQKHTMTVEKEHQELLKQVEELKAAKQQLIEEQEKLKSFADQSSQDIKHMVANVAHDLKTPLAAFLSGAESIQQIVQEMKNHLAIADVHTPKYGSFKFTPKAATIPPTTDTPVLSHLLPSPISISNTLPVQTDFVKNNLDNIMSNIVSMMDINTFMTMTINRCIDSTKASQGHKLTPKYDTIDLLETVKLPLKCIQSMQSSTTKLAISLQFCNPEICSHIITDKQWLQENLLCLLSNAVKYSFEGTISVKLFLFSPQYLQTFRIDSEIEIEGSKVLTPTKRQLDAFSIASSSQKQRPSIHRPSSFATGQLTEAALSGSSSSSHVHYPWARMPTADNAIHPIQEEMRRSPNGKNSYSSPRSHEVCLENISPLKPSQMQAVYSSPDNTAASPSIRRYSVDSSFDDIPLVPCNYEPSDSYSVTNEPDMFASPTRSASQQGPSIKGLRSEYAQARSSSNATTTVDDFEFSNRSRSYSVSQNHVGSSSQPTYLIVEVEDEGGGVTEEAMKTLFTAFVQAQKKAGGTGLGLYSLSKRMEALGGFYGVEGRRDGKRGSLFWFAFPYRADEQISQTKIHQNKLHDLRVELHNASSACGENSSKTQMPLLSKSISATDMVRTNTVPPLNQGIPVKKLHILVVDDTFTVLKMVAQSFSKYGHRVETAVNGLDALNKVSQKLKDTPEEPYDCILMDLNMPVIDGLEATRRMRQAESNSHQRQTRHLIIGVSADSETETVDTAYTAGVDEFICKPYTLNTFHETYQRIESYHVNYLPPTLSMSDEELRASDDNRSRKYKTYSNGQNESIPHIELITPGQSSYSKSIQDQNFTNMSSSSA